MGAQTKMDGRYKMLNLSSDMTFHLNCSACSLLTQCAYDFSCAPHFSKLLQAFYVNMTSRFGVHSSLAKRPRGIVDKNDPRHINSKLALTLSRIQGRIEPSAISPEGGQSYVLHAASTSPFPRQSQILCRANCRAHSLIRRNSRNQKSLDPPFIQVHHQRRFDKDAMSVRRYDDLVEGRRG